MKTLDNVTKTKLYDKYNIPFHNTLKKAKLSFMARKCTAAKCVAVYCVSHVFRWNMRGKSVADHYFAAKGEDSPAVPCLRSPWLSPSNNFSKHSESLYVLFCSSGSWWQCSDLASALYELLFTCFMSFSGMLEMRERAAESAKLLRHIDFAKRCLLDKNLALVTNTPLVNVVASFLYNFRDVSSW